MRNRVHFLVLCGLMPLNGCVVGSLLNSLSPVPDLSGNWQIVSTSGSKPTTPPPGLVLVGSLSSQGSNVTGLFRLANLTLPYACGTPLQQVVAVSGSIDSSRNLTLTSVPFSGSTLTMKFIVPLSIGPVGAGASLTPLAGTVAITGGTCTFASSTAIGSEIVSITGTFAGPLTASTYLANPPIPTGTASLSLAQAASSQIDGQFPVTGTLKFTGGTCTSSTPLAGTVSGTELTLASAPTGLFNTSTTNMVILINLATGQLDVAILSYGLGPCNTGVTSFTQYTGSLTRQ